LSTAEECGRPLLGARLVKSLARATNRSGAGYAAVFG